MLQADLPQRRVSSNSIFGRFRRAAMVVFNTDDAAVFNRTDTDEITDGQCCQIVIVIMLAPGRVEKDEPGGCCGQASLRVASRLSTWAASPQPSFLIFALSALSAASLVSRKTTCNAPRDHASSPRLPQPAKISAITRASSGLPNLPPASRLKRPSRVRSAVGRPARLQER